MRDLADIQAFSALCTHQSLTRAARALDLPKSTVSRRLTHLEGDLGQSLVIRDGQRLQLTEAGRIFALYCQQLLELADQSRNALQELQEEASGRLSIAVHAALKRGWLMQVLDEFIAEHPGISLNLYTQQLTQHQVGRLDLWIWLGDFPLSGYRRENLGSWPFGLFAAPSYLQQQGYPRHPQDLLQHQWIDQTGRLKAGLSLYHPEQGYFALPAMDSRWCSDSLVLQADLIRQGKGVGLLPLWMADKYNQAHPGSLESCLPSWQADASEINLYYTLGRPPKRVSVLLNCLRHQCPTEWQTTSHSKAREAKCKDV